MLKKRKIQNINDNNEFNYEDESNIIKLFNLIISVIAILCPFIGVGILPTIVLSITVLLPKQKLASFYAELTIIICIARLLFSLFFGGITFDSIISNIQEYGTKSIFYNNENYNIDFSYPHTQTYGPGSINNETYINDDDSISTIDSNSSIDFTSPDIDNNGANTFVPWS